MSLVSNDLLTHIENKVDPKLGIYLRKLESAIDSGWSRAGVSGTGNIAPPAPPESVNVVTSGEMMQVRVNHVAPVQKGVKYIYSIADNPQFTGALIESKDATRAPVHFTMPTKNAAGDTHQYHVAVQVQYPGSEPSVPTFYGGVTPKAITLSGTTQLDLLPGTGAGTALNGGQALVGIGKTLLRPAPSPKRSV